MIDAPYTIGYSLKGASSTCKCPSKQLKLPVYLAEAMLAVFVEIRMRMKSRYLLSLFDGGVPGYLSPYNATYLCFALGECRRRCVVSQLRVKAAEGNKNEK